MCDKERKMVIETSINLEALDPVTREQIVKVLEDRERFKNKYLKWKTRYYELERWHKQLQDTYKENMKELQKHVGVLTMNNKVLTGIVGIIFILLWLTLSGTVGYSLFAELNNVLNLNPKLLIVATHLVVLITGTIVLIVAFLMLIELIVKACRWL